MRVEDMYVNKFHKEAYVHWHIYAQNFHPEALLERVRSAAFYRRPRSLFKGFTVPDWAQYSGGRDGWDIDLYSRRAWENAMQDMRAEWTPMPFTGERQEPNALQWLRTEQFFKGHSRRLFYNEAPKANWVREGGHLEDPDKTMYSFKWGNQDTELFLGIDTTTEEGRDKFKEEWER